jgi:hypothetical protein
VRASVYFDATIRHLFSWWEGEDIDPDSGLHHVTKALSSLTVLRDAQLQGMCTDDRPPVSPKGWVAAFSVRAAELLRRYEERGIDPVPPYTQIDLAKGKDEK